MASKGAPRPPEWQNAVGLLNPGGTKDLVVAVCSGHNCYRKAHNWLL